MKLLYTSLALGALAALVVAWRFGDARGTGVLLGAFSGLTLSGAAIAWQRQLLTTNPGRAMTVFGIAFLVKLAFLVTTALVLRLREITAVDWVTFLVSFPIAVVWTTCTGWVGAFQPMRRNLNGAH